MAPATPASLAIRSTNVALAVLLLTATLAGLTILTPSADAAPVVLTITPVSGSENGGTAVTITGTGFTTGPHVTFDGVVARSITFVSATSITAITPPGTPGTADVTVTNANGEATTASGEYTYIAAGAPDVTAVSPTSGTSNGGTSITITGTGFATGATVALDGVAATVTSVSSTSIVAVTTGQAADTVDVTVTNPDGDADTLANSFAHVAADEPVISFIAPSTGTIKGGTQVVVTGSGFAAGAIVTVDGTDAASVTFTSATSLTFITPEGALSGAKNVVVTNPDTQASDPATFNYQAHTASLEPTITTVSPTKGSTLGGTEVTITGTNFHTGTNEKPTVYFGATPAVAADVSVSSATQIVVKSPPVMAAGLVDITVSNPGGTATDTTTTDNAVEASNAFTYVAPRRINSLENGGCNGGSISSGTSLGGTTVDLVGTGLPVGTTDVVVKFGGTVVQEVVDSTATCTTVITPAHAAGTVTIELFGQDGIGTTFSNGFTYLQNAGARTIDSVTCIALCVSSTSGSTNGGSEIRVVPDSSTAVFGPITLDDDGDGCDSSADYDPDGDSVAGEAGKFMDVDDEIVTLVPTVTVGNVAATRVCVYSMDVDPGTPVDTRVVLNAIVPARPSEGAVTQQKVKVTLPDGQVWESDATDNADDFDYVLADAPVLAAVTDSSGAVDPQGPTTGGTVLIIRGSDFHKASNAKPVVKLGGPSGTAIAPANIFVLLEGAITDGDFRFTAYDDNAGCDPCAAGTTVDDTDPDTDIGDTVDDEFEILRVDVGVAGASTDDRLYGDLDGDGEISDGDFRFTAYSDGVGCAPCAAGTTVDDTGPDTDIGDAVDDEFDILRVDVGVAGETTDDRLYGDLDGGALNANCTPDGDGATDMCIITVTPALSGTSALTAKTVYVQNPNTESDVSAALDDDFEYEAPLTPSITAVTDGSGVAIGGEEATITHSNYGPITLDDDGEGCGDAGFMDPDSADYIVTPVPTVTFGGTAATHVCVDSATTLYATTPGHAIGSVTVVVTNPDTKTDSEANAWDYVLSTGPTITGVDDSACASTDAETGSLLGGRFLLICGSNFPNPATFTSVAYVNTVTEPQPTITFGGTAVPAADVTLVDATTLQIENVPAHAVGSVTIQVTNPDGSVASVGGKYRYIAAAPAITSLSPNSGTRNGGTAVTITGTGFDAVVDPTVTFGTDTALAVVGTVSATSAAVTSPAHTATGQVNVVMVEKDGMTATMRNAYTYTFAQSLSYKSISPATASANGGATVTLTGNGFVAGSEVTVDGAEATGESSSSTSTLTFVTPNIVDTTNQMLGPLTLVITNPDTSTLTLTDVFAYSTAAGPSISSVSPTTGIAGDTVTIDGANFVSGATVKFDTTSASGVTFVSSTRLTATAPSHAAGAADVTVTNPGGESTTLADAFTYQTVGAAPSITSIDPDCSELVAGGELVTITGTGFAAGATVMFGTDAGTDVDVVSATTITVETPAHAVGEVTVTVTNTDTQSDTIAFTYAADCTTVTPPTPPVTTPPVTTPPVTTPPVTSPPDLTDEEVAAANEDLMDSLDVERDGEDNVLTFEVPEDAVGVQIWSANSPFTLAEEFETGDDEFDSGTWVDEGAPADTEYVVTAYYEGDVGRCDETDPEDCFDNWDDLEGQAATASASDGDAEGIPLWVWILIGGAILLIVLIVIAVVVTKRKKTDEEAARGEGYAWEDQPPVAAPEEAAAPVPAEPVQEHAMQCPSCKTTFKATGARPLTTTCPGCGKKGILR